GLSPSELGRPSGLVERALEPVVSAVPSAPAAAECPVEAAPGRDVLCPIPANFRLMSGETLAAVTVVGRLHGPEAGPLVVVIGGISSGRFVSQWWSWAVKPGGPVDLNRLRVLAVDLLPGKDEPGE